MNRDHEDLANGPLWGQHAVVTGGSRGIGAAIADRLAACGAAVTVMGRTQKTLNDKVQSMAQSGAMAAAQCVDVTQADAVTRAFAAAADWAGPVSILVNNAGGAQSASFSKTSADLWEDTIALNLTSAYHCIQAVLPGMQSANAGRIVTVASTAALKGYPYVAAYCAAKHGVVGLTRSLAMELAGTGITVNAVCPGFADTDMTRDSINTIVEKTGRDADSAHRELASMNPQGRLIQPDEVAHAVEWLCDPAASAITGQAIPVAGGEIT